MAFYKSLWPFSYPYYQEQMIKKEWYGQGDTPASQSNRKEGGKKGVKHINEQPPLGINWLLAIHIISLHFMNRSRTNQL